MFAFLVVFCLSGELALILQCKPVKYVLNHITSQYFTNRTPRAGYDKTILSAKCYSTDMMYGITLYQGVLMFLADVVIIILPMPALWTLQLPLKRRLILVGLFSFGTQLCHKTWINSTDTE